MFTFIKCPVLIRTAVHTQTFLSVHLFYQPQVLDKNLKNTWISPDDENKSIVNNM